MSLFDIFFTRTALSLFLFNSVTLNYRVGTKLLDSSIFSIVQSPDGAAASFFPPMIQNIRNIKVTKIF